MSRYNKFIVSCRLPVYKVWRETLRADDFCLTAGAEPCSQNTTCLKYLTPVIDRTPWRFIGNNRTTLGNCQMYDMCI